MSAPVRIAVVQSRIERDISANGAHIRALLETAAAKGASLALFPEGALSGYCKAQITDWTQVDWPLLSAELAAVKKSARALGIVAVVGAAHPIADRRPHNSVYALPSALRYDKRYLSNTEINDWFTPGIEPKVLCVGDYAFGLTICIEVHFPELYMAYEALGVDCILHATYGVGPVGDVLLRSHAAVNCVWMAVATPANADSPASGIISPDGEWLARCQQGVDIAVATLDRDDPDFDIALNRARPWRRRARQGQIYRDAL